MLNFLTGGILTKVGLVALVLMSGTIFYLHIQNQNLNKKIDVVTENIKSIQYGTKSFKNDLGKYQSSSIQEDKTVTQLRNSKDSMTNEYIKLLKETNISLRKVTQIGQISTKFKHDSTIVYKHKDTTYDFSKKPYIINTVRIKGDSISSNLEITNKQSLVWHTNRETIDSRKHFFISRWLQKKQNVTYVDIVNDNPYIQTTKQNFQIITK